jgi:MFS transporter, DHA2 family, multidrug resistance protein
VLAVVGLIALVAWELRQAKGANLPILDLGLFTSRNFSTSFLMMFAFGFTLYATTVLLPQLLQTLMGYTAELSGFAMSSGGLATIICMPIVGILISKLDGRYLILFGFTSMALAVYYMMLLDLQMSFAYAAKLRFLQSIGLAFLFVPINTLIYVGVSPSKNNDVSGLANLARNIGGCAGTSFFTTVLARHQQVHQQYLVQRVSGGNAAYLERTGLLTRHLLAGGTDLTGAQRKAILVIYQSVQTQASVLSYIDVLEFLAIMCACMVPLVFLLKKPPRGTTAAVH